jgi:hypothetical protein
MRRATGYKFANVQIELPHVLWYAEEILANTVQLLSKVDTRHKFDIELIHQRSVSN